MKSKDKIIQDILVNRFRTSDIGGLIWDEDYLSDIYDTQYHLKKHNKEMRIKRTGIAVCPSHVIALLLKSDNAKNLLSSVLYTDDVFDAEHVKKIMSDNHEDADDATIRVGKAMLRDILDFLDLTTGDYSVQLIIRRNKRNGMKILLIDTEDVRFAVSGAEEAVRE